MAKVLIARPLKELDNQLRLEPVASLHVLGGQSLAPFCLFPIREDSDATTDKIVDPFIPDVHGISDASAVIDRAVALLLATRRWPAKRRRGLRDLLRQRPRRAACDIVLRSGGAYGGR